MQFTPFAALAIGLAVLVIGIVVATIVTRARTMERRRRRWLTDGR